MQPRAFFLMGIQLAGSVFLHTAVCKITNLFLDSSGVKRTHQDTKKIKGILVKMAMKTKNNTSSKTKGKDNL